MTTVTFLIIEKNGSIKEQTLKNFDESILYKKAGFKTPEGFICHTEWNIEELNDKSYSISVYGKTTGRANQENKFEFPPPIDNTLFFGNCIILNKIDGEPANLTEKEWDSVYEYLYGGFEDIGEDDSDEEEDEDDELPRTKSGYVKDEFIVDDDEEDEEEDEEEEEEEEEEVFVAKSKKSKAKAVTKKESKAKGAKKPALVNVFESFDKEEDNYLDCTSELSEEAYIE